MPERPLSDAPIGGPESLAVTLGRVLELMETRIAPALERIATALETRGVPGTPDAPPVPISEGRAAALGAIRLAIAESLWDRAEALLESLVRESPDDPQALSLREEVARGREAAILDLRGRLDASRGVNDPESVIALHDELTVLLRGEARRELEQEVVRWLIGLIQRRMRAGTVRPDVVELAAQVADRFGTTAEGASVRASLPTLRRSAGLCPRCGAPYTGFEAACPRCLAGAAAAPAAWPQDEESEEEEEPPASGPDPDDEIERLLS